MSNFTNMKDFIATSICLMEKTGKPVITASQVDEFIGESTGNVEVVDDSDSSRIFHWNKETGDWNELMGRKKI
jgi:hypothetical protein